MRAGVIGGEEHMTNSRLCVLIELARIAVADPLPDLWPQIVTWHALKKGHREIRDFIAARMPAPSSKRKSWRALLSRFTNAGQNNRQAPA
jgi:hypothetical protein